MALGVALDLGTSGYRGHLVDLDRKGKILATAITMRHPLPGANIMDHLHFWLENGSEVGHRIVIETVDKLISTLGAKPEEIARVSVCGNPAQMSMFENIEIRDLAFAGQSILKRLNVKVPERKAHSIKAEELGMNSVRRTAEVRIPPSIRHEIGADALAMIMKTGLMDKKETCMVTDYGTNAEMGLFHNGELYTGSAAAGPAMEGQSIQFGMLAAPQAISDVIPTDDGRWYNMVLSDKLHPIKSSIVDPRNGAESRLDGVVARGITGTGVVAAMAMGLEAGIIKLPYIETPDRRIHLTNGIYFGEEDVREAGKAFGAIRAGHRTLIEEVGIDDFGVRTMYMAGASGTYVDPLKAQTVGLIPRVLDKTVQAGNTSLMMSYDILVDDDGLDRMQDVANSIASKHIMFATSKIFEDMYVNEIAYWTEGMSLEMYNEMIQFSGLRPLPEIKRPSETIRLVVSDIPVIGAQGLKTLDDVGVFLVGSFEGCIGCKKCQKACPECALQVSKIGEKKFQVRINTEHCLGTACKKCQAACPEDVYNFSEFKIVRKGEDA
ncbi:MAG TPA: methylamine methyltransferase corrinoid protein reductive activase [Methanomassiliicoccales archaeon]|nr:methylamine methyltransferase corrinoid protein reductive activase [Methanomassiliicoccales archaeon]